MRGVLACSVLIVACGHAPPSTVIEIDAAVVAEPVPPPPPPPPPEPTHVTRTRAWAVFVEDELDQCIEHTRRFDIPVDTDWSPGPMPDLEPLPEGRVIELSTGCAASFEGRSVLATCESTVDHLGVLEAVPSGVAVLESFTTQSYRFTSALRTDARLEACLASGQHWSAVADDSADYVRARSRARERRMDARR